MLVVEWAATPVWFWFGYGELWATRCERPGKVEAQRVGYWWGQGEERAASEWECNVTPRAWQPRCFSVGYEGIEKSIQAELISQWRSWVVGKEMWRSVRGGKKIKRKLKSYVQEIGLWLLWIDWSGGCLELKERKVELRNAVQEIQSGSQWGSPDRERAWEPMRLAVLGLDLRVIHMTITKITHAKVVLVIATHWWHNLVVSVTRLCVCARLELSDFLRRLASWACEETHCAVGCCLRTVSRTFTPSNQAAVNMRLLVKT